MVRPMLSVSRKTLGSNGSFRLLFGTSIRFIAAPPSCASSQEAMNGQHRAYKDCESLRIKLAGDGLFKIAHIQSGPLLIVQPTHPIIGPGRGTDQLRSVKL